MVLHCNHIGEHEIGVTMAATDTMTETIRIRIEPEKKAALTRLYKQRGTNISQVAREFFDEQLEDMADPLDQFDAIMSSTDAKLDAYDAPEPTVDDIVKYVESVRAERTKDATVCA